VEHETLTQSINPTYSQQKFGDDNSLGPDIHRAQLALIVG